MRALLALTVVMGVLIVLGTATIAITIVHRMGAATPRTLAGGVLDEPAGTHIVSAAAYGDRLALVLQGGGPDRVVIIDPTTGQSLGRVTLAH
jgi:ABC-type Na+ efflux pump permease subunit